MNKFPWKRLLPAGVLAFLLSLVAIFLFLVKDARPTPSWTDAINGGEASSQTWLVPTFEGRDQHNQAFSSDQLKGQVWIANFMFTTCTSACPVLTSRLRLVQREVAHPELRFVSISVDPEHDSPSALKAYANTWNANESRWTLLHVEPDQLKKALNGFHVEVARTTDANDPIIHSASFVLIDEQGHVRGRYNSERGESIQRLIADAQSLAAQSKTASSAAAQPASGQVGTAAETAAGTAAGTAAETAGTAGTAGHDPAVSGSTASPANLRELATGEQLFQDLACQGCHMNPKVAPPLGGVAGRTVTLDDGSTLVADDAYLRESILEPAKKVVAGYLKLMPYYRDFLSDAEVEKLVAYLHSLPTAELSSDAAASPMMEKEPPPRVEQDPVCGMQVMGRADAIQHTHAGKTYFFCSESCKKAFSADPERYLKRPGTSGMP